MDSFFKDHRGIDDRRFDLIEAVLPTGPETYWNREMVGEEGVVYFNNLSHDAHFGLQWSNYQASSWKPYLAGEKISVVLSNYGPFISKKDMTILIESQPNEFYPIILPKDTCNTGDVRTEADDSVVACDCHDCSSLKRYGVKCECKKCRRTQASVDNIHSFDENSTIQNKEKPGETMEK